MTRSHESESCAAGLRTVISVITFFSFDDARNISTSLIRLGITLQATLSSDRVADHGPIDNVRHSVIYKSQSGADMISSKENASSTTFTA